MLLQKVTTATKQEPARSQAKNRAKNMGGFHVFASIFLPFSIDLGGIARTRRQVGSQGSEGRGGAVSIVSSGNYLPFEVVGFALWKIEAFGNRLKSRASCRGTRVAMNFLA
jgi:hypothetical protein